MEISEENVDVVVLFEGYAFCFDMFPCWCTIDGCTSTKYTTLHASVDYLMKDESNVSRHDDNACLKIIG